MGRSSSISIPTGWWAAGLNRNRGLFEVFNRRPASLEGAVCLRTSFSHIPESIHLTIELADAPDPLPARWAARGNNALRLRIQVSNLLDIHAHGHLTGGLCSIEVATTSEGVLTRTWNPTYEARMLSLYGSIGRLTPFHRHAPGTPGKEDGSWREW